MSLFDLSLVTFEIDHEDCWSKLTADYPIVVRTLFAKSAKGKDHILGMDEIKVYKNQDFKNFLRAFKKDKRIYEVIDVTELDRRRGIYRILFKERYENMIMSIIENYTIFYLKDLIKNGYERLLIIMPLEDVSSLRSDLEVLGKVKYFNTTQIDVNTFMPTFFDLSEQERRAIIEAIKMGYYEYPRKISLDDLGKMMGLSKPTLEEYIRKAEKKIMSKFFSEVLQYNLLSKTDE
ncbi:helix-turn-helix domain-containing protein [Sulfolobus tengchongensis]|uniref:Helix-turn-helix domain-containing protein n=1 Tax=Sulfolobus tengchongensis TaxID=207809 RepID=A0AAX4L251_9CREN